MTDTPTPRVLTPERIAAFRICGMSHGCAKAIHNGRPPSAAYAQHVGQLLFGTAAQESHLVYRRQMGFSMTDSRGGWGLWQLEQGSVGDSITYVNARVALRERVDSWLSPAEQLVWERADVPVLMRMLTEPEWDRAACLVARLHYMRFPAPVPASIREQAAYWKKYYNTYLGAGTPEQYSANWKRRCLRPDCERMIIEAAMERHGGDIEAAAAAIGDDPKLLHDKLCAFLGTEKETDDVGRDS